MDGFFGGQGTSGVNSMPLTPSDDEGKTSWWNSARFIGVSQAGLVSAVWTKKWNIPVTEEFPRNRRAACPMFAQYNSGKVLLNSTIFVRKGEAAYGSGK